MNLPRASLAPASLRHHAPEIGTDEAVRAADLAGHAIVVATGLVGWTRLAGVGRDVAKARLTQRSRDLRAVARLANGRQANVVADQIDVIGLNRDAVLRVVAPSHTTLSLRTGEAALTAATTAGCIRPFHVHRREAKGAQCCGEASASHLRDDIAAGSPFGE